jgi:Fe-S cluster assembly scaffold protein SufB
LIKNKKHGKSREKESSQQSVLDRISSTHFPMNNLEDYRFSEHRALVRKKPMMSKPLNAVEARILITMMKQFHLVDSFAVYINGYFNVQFSTIDYIQTNLLFNHSSSLKDLLNVAKNQCTSFVGLNSVFMENSLCIIADKNLSKNVLLLCIDGTEEDHFHLIGSSLSTTAILGKSHISLSITEEFISLRGDSIFTSSLLAVQMSSFANVSHHFKQLKAPGKNAFSFKSTYVQQESFSNYRQNETRMGAGKTRHDVFVNTLGPETVTSLKHLLITEEPQSQELISKIRLDYPKATVNQLFKLIAGTRGTGVFDGNIKVNLPANKSSAHQLSKILLLGNISKAIIKPNLQIAADEVKCSHGCSASNISKDEIFYLNSRGILKKMAEQELGLSFRTDVMNEIGNTKLKSVVEDGLTVLLTIILDLI